MAVQAGQVVCPSNTGTTIVAAANTNAIYSGQRGQARDVTLYNPSAQGIFVGPTGAATEFLLAAGSTIRLSLNQGEALLGRGASSSPTIHYLVTGA